MIKIPPEIEVRVTLFYRDFDKENGIVGWEITFS